MVAGTTSREEPKETELLVQFEIDNFPAEYREYYRAKRNNLFASIQGFPEVWRLYISLDEIWLRSFNDLKPARDADRMFPLLLYFNAHAKIRLAMELAFSGCMAEARSLLRDGIEFVAHAHAMLGDTELQKTWLNKNDGKVALEAFADAFERQKKEGVFKGLEELHKTWGQFSETGSHATLNAMCDRFVQVKAHDYIEFRLNYCGGEPQLWEMSLFVMLLTTFTMEQVMFGDYEARLKLDASLMGMRAKFEIEKELLRKTIIAKYNIKPPSEIYVPRPPIYRP